MLKRLAEWVAKSNPAQEEIYHREQSAVSNINITFKTAYNKVEAVSRGVNLIVDCSSDISFDINKRLPYFSTSKRVNQKPLEMLLTGRPNPFIDKNFFRRTIYMDLILSGNAYIYFDGDYMYNIPADSMEVVSDSKKRISHYVYGNNKYYPNEIIHIADNSSTSYLIGESRLKAAELSAKTLYLMVNMQKEYIENGMTLGDVLLNKDMLGKKQKQRYLSEIHRSVGRNRKRLAFLDGGTTLDRGKVHLKEELDFDTSIKGHEGRIFQALGVPSILVDGGNNANIMPNMKLFYLTTVLPLVQKLESAFEAFFGYDIRVNTADVVALRPELREFSSYLVSLTNNGLLTQNEARDKLRMNRFIGEEYDTPRNPANITGGSAVRPETGGRPTEEDTDE